jgi:hypothetical protein
MTLTLIYVRPVFNLSIHDTTIRFLFSLCGRLIRLEGSEQLTRNMEHEATERHAVKCIQKKRVILLEASCQNSAI